MKELLAASEPGTTSSRLETKPAKRAAASTDTSEAANSPPTRSQIRRHGREGLFHGGDAFFDFEHGILVQRFHAVLLTDFF